MSGAESTALGPESELFIIINIILTKTGQQKALVEGGAAALNPTIKSLNRTKPTPPLTSHLSQEIMN